MAVCIPSTVFYKNIILLLANCFFNVFFYGRPYAKAVTETIPVADVWCVFFLIVPNNKAL